MQRQGDNYESRVPEYPSEKVPCLLYSDYSNEKDEIKGQATKLDFRKLSLKKKEATFKLNVKRVLNDAPEGYVGTLLLTFAGNPENHEISRCLNSFQTGFLKKNHFFRGRRIRVKEWKEMDRWPKNGRWHIHFLLTLTVDIRIRKIRNSVNRKIHAVLTKYGFGYIGRIQSIHKPEAINSYLFKGLESVRNEHTKGVRLIEKSRVDIWDSEKFQPLTPGSKIFRQAMAIFAKKYDCTEDNISKKLGAQYVHYYWDEISEIMAALRRPITSRYRDIMAGIPTLH